MRERSRGRLRVRLRRVRAAAADLWDQSIEPLDRFVARQIFRASLDARAQIRLLHVWLGVR